MSDSKIVSDAIRKKKVGVVIGLLAFALTIVLYFELDGDLSSKFAALSIASIAAWGGAFLGRSSEINARIEWIRFVEKQSSVIGEQEATIEYLAAEIEKLEFEKETPFPNHPAAKNERN